MRKKKLYSHIRLSFLCRPLQDYNVRLEYMLTFGTKIEYNRQVPSPAEREIIIMKNLLYPLLLLSTLVLPLQGDASEECLESKDYLFEFTTGYRQDQLKIEVSPAEDTLVISTNDWKDIDIVQFRLACKAETDCNTYSRAYFNYGRIVNFHHGLVSPNLALDSSQTYQDKGRVYDVEYACGLSLYLCDSLRLTPLMGYSYHRMEMRDKNRVPRDLPPTSEEDASYDYFRVYSDQRTTWRAPFVGMEAELQLCGLRTCLNGQYLWAHYTNHGTVNEKYVQGYKYHQYSNGHGVILYGEMGYEFLDAWEVLVTGGYQYWDAKGGSDKTKHSADPDTVIKSPFKKACWNSYEISLGLAYAF